MKPRILVLLLIFTLSLGCKTTHKVERHDYTLNSKKEYLTDSTRVKMIVETIEKYRPDGMIEEKMTRQESDTQFSVILQRDTVAIAVRDTIYLEKEANMQGVQKTASEVKWTVWGVLILCGIVLVARLRGWLRRYL